MHPTLGEILWPTIANAPEALVLDDNGAIVVVMLCPHSINQVVEAVAMQVLLRRGPLVLT